MSVCGSWIVIAAAAGLAQSQTFEVATIKPSGDCGGMEHARPGRLKLGCATVSELIQMAHGYFANGVSYTPKILQISGGPSWVGSDRYDVEATADGNPSQALMRGPMLRALLADRFQLRFHHDTKEGAVYVMTVAKGGVKMPAMAEGSCTPVDMKSPPAPGSPPVNLCGHETRKKSGQVMTVNVHGISAADLADGLFVELSGRTVIDKTGLRGLFDLQLEFTPDQNLEDGTGLSIFTAMQEQLGLKLESGKGPVKVFVVDRVERPSGN